MSYQTLTQDQSFLLQTGTPTVSLWVPTHRVSHPDNQHIDQVRFRNQVREAQTLLDLNFPDQVALHTQLDQLAAQWADDPDFWRYQSDSLAIFVTAEEVHWYSLPLQVPAMTYVAPQAYLLPLINMLHQQHRFFILALSQQEVSFFEADRFFLHRVQIDDLVPASLEAHRGPRRSAPGLQYHAPTSRAEPIFHGRGGPRERHGQELEAYLKAVDRGLMEMLHDEDAPLVVAAVDDTASRYQRLSRYPHLVTPHLSGNFEQAGLMDLYERAYEAVRPVFRQAYMAAVERLQAQPSRTTSQLDTLLDLAQQGRLDTLVIREGYHAWGQPQGPGGALTRHEARRPGSLCLLNHLALLTLTYGGEVWCLPAGEMPEPRINLLGLRRD